MDNLLGNAIKYSPRPDTIYVEVTRHGDSAPLWVTDHGVGIPSDELTRVLDRFHRGTNVSPEMRGSGIGLHGIRQIVEQHGGSVGVESQPGTGSTFTVRLPLRPVVRWRCWTRSGEPEQQVRGVVIGVQTRDWRQRTQWIADLLKRRTGEDLEAWKARVAASDFADEASLRTWLTEQGVTGYPQMLLVMERFGYPDFLLASADELIDEQYADREELRPILDAILARAASLGEVTVQARKGYVSLLTPKRTFAAIQPTTRKRVDLGLKLKDPRRRGPLAANSSMGSSVVNARIPLSSVDDVNDEVDGLLREAYADNT